MGCHRWLPFNFGCNSGVIKERGLCYSWGKGSFADRIYRFTSEWGITLCGIAPPPQKKKNLPLYYHEAEWSTLSSWCLDPIKFFNLKPYPEPLSTMPSWTSLSCWEHVEKGLCTVWQRLSSPPCLRISSWVAMVTSSTLQKPFFFATDEVIIANLLLANIFSKEEMCVRYEPHGGSVQKNCRKERSITEKYLVRRVTGLNESVKCWEATYVSPDRDITSGW